MRGTTGSITSIMLIEDKEVPYRQPPIGEVTDLVINATGVAVFDEDEWKVKNKVMVSAGYVGKPGDSRHRDGGGLTGELALKA